MGCGEDPYRGWMERLAWRCSRAQREANLGSIQIIQVYSIDHFTALRTCVFKLSRTDLGSDFCFMLHAVYIVYTLKMLFMMF